jgi:hypothetical protein
MEITTSQAVATMQKEGGNGMQKLAACWLAMDPENRKRLELAFAPEFADYRKNAQARLAQTEGPVERIYADRKPQAAPKLAGMYAEDVKAEYRIKESVYMLDTALERP